MKTYETPTLEVVDISEDIITTSIGLETSFLPVEDEGWIFG